MTPDDKRSYRPEGIADDATLLDESQFDPSQDQPEPDSADSPSPGTGKPQRKAVADIGMTGMLRFIWRQLTSMRVALLLLMLLAAAAIPGSIVPQRSADPRGYADYIAQYPERVEWFNKLQLFDVYTSVWFSAIYILLFISLIGCILPRTKVHLRALRAEPPRTPRNFDRLPAHHRIDLAAEASAASAGATDTSQDERSAAPRDSSKKMAAQGLRYLKGGWLRRYRVVAETEPDGVHVLRAERGYARETGNLLFHIALVGLLLSVAAGHLLHYRGQVILVQGRGFANAQVDYNTFEAGAWFDPQDLHPFRMTLDRFDAQFRLHDAAAEDFTAHVTIDDNGQVSQETIKVNHPLEIGGAKIYLQGNGYAPVVSVTDSDGNIAFAGSVPFIPDDNVYTSQGTIKVPDVTSGDQFGLVGYLLPTAEQPAENVWRSIYPEPLDPVLVLSLWHGDLGLDEGIPQNVYRLDTSRMTQVTQGDDAVTIVLRPGESIELPEGLGTLAFEGIDRYVALDLRHDPSLAYVLISSVAAMVGLAMSLFIPRRRMWLRVRDGVVEAGGLAKTDDFGLERAVRSLAEAAAYGQPLDDRDSDTVTSD